MLKLGAYFSQCHELHFYNKQLKWICQVSDFYRIHNPNAVQTLQGYGYTPSSVSFWKKFYQHLFAYFLVLMSMVQSRGNKTWKKASKKTAFDSTYLISCKNRFVPLTLCTKQRKFRNDHSLLIKIWIHFSPVLFIYLFSPCRGDWGPAATSAGFFYIHTGLVLTPLADFTELSDCRLNTNRLVFHTCPSRFAALAAQSLQILIIHQLGTAKHRCLL